jgi:hypothetical protein
MLFCGCFAIRVPPENYFSFDFTPGKVLGGLFPFTEQSVSELIAIFVDHCVAGRAEPNSILRCSSLFGGQILAESWSTLARSRDVGCLCDEERR